MDYIVKLESQNKKSIFYLAISLVEYGFETATFDSQLGQGIKKKTMCR